MTRTSRSGARPSRWSSGSSSPRRSAPFIAERFAATRRTITTEALAGVLDDTGGHPYATQELCYFVWNETPPRAEADEERVGAALERSCGPSTRTSAGLGGVRRSSACCCRRSRASPAGRWPPTTGAATGSPAPSATQRALEYLERGELVAAPGGEAWIAEPFLAAWLRRLA